MHKAILQSIINMILGQVWLGQSHERIVMSQCHIIAFLYKNKYAFSPKLCHFNVIIVYSLNYISLLSFIRLYVSGRMLSDDADEHNGDTWAAGQTNGWNYSIIWTDIWWVYLLHMIVLTLKYESDKHINQICDPQCMEKPFSFNTFLLSSHTNKHEYFTPNLALNHSYPNH